MGLAEDIRDSIKQQENSSDFEITTELKIKDLNETIEKWNNSEYFKNIIGYEEW